MALAKFRNVYGKNPSGRFVVSEGVAPAEYILPSVGLPTRYYDIADWRLEIVIPKGTILSTVTDSFGDPRMVPANGTASNFVWGDGQISSTVYGTNPLLTGATPASGSGTNVDTTTVLAKSVPVGCAQIDAYRPFDKGTSYAVSWIKQGYVEWPIVNGINANIAAGDCVKSDAMGRPVKMTLGTDEHWLQVGKVIAIEKFATNFDDGLLSYMQLPSDPGALKDVYAITATGPYQGKMGIRGNLDRANVVGAMRVALTL